MQVLFFFNPAHNVERGNGVIKISACIFHFYCYAFCYQATFKNKLYILARDHVAVPLFRSSGPYARASRSTYETFILKHAYLDIVTYGLRIGKNEKKSLEWRD